MDKAAGGVGFFCHILADAAAGVDGKGEVEGQLGLALEEGDLLRAAVFGDGEVVAGEAADDGAVAIGDIDEDVDQLDIDVEGAFPARRAGAGRTSMSSEQESGAHPGSMRAGNFDGYEPARGPPAGTAQMSGGKRLAGGPYGAVGKGLLLPDGDRVLEGVDEPAAGFEGLSAMGGSDDDEHAGFADLEAAEAMDDGDVANAELSARLGGQFAHLLDGHLFVGFVVEVEGLAAAGVVAHDAVEDDDGAVFAAFGRGNELGRVDGFAGERGCRRLRLSLRILCGARRRRRAAGGRLHRRGEAGGWRWRIRR